MYGVIIYNRKIYLSVPPHTTFNHDTWHNGNVKIFTLVLTKYY